MNFYSAEGLLRKASEHWAGARAEEAGGRFSTEIALAYYACFQTVIAEHIRRGWPPDRGHQYSHGLSWRSASIFFHEAGRPTLMPGLRRLYGARVEAQYRAVRHSAADCVTMMSIAQDVLEAIHSPRSRS